jgi:hypothetical protein
VYARTFCDGVLQDVYQNQWLSEDGLIAEFAPAEYVPGHSQGLSNIPSQVVRVRTRGGYDYVVRFPSQTQDLGLEQFANSFIREAPGSSAPKVRRLGPEDSRQLFDRMMADPAIEEKIKDGWKKSEYSKNPNFTVSVTAYYPVANGEEALAQLRVMDPVRKELLEVSAGGELFRKEYFDEVWAELSPSQQLGVIEDVKAIWPEARSVPNERFRDFLHENSQKIPKDQLRKLFTMGVERLPAEVRAQLVDDWVLFSVLGLPDFHPGNWLLYGKKVLPIDMAYPTGLEGSLMHPFGGEFALTHAEQSWLARQATPGLRQYLREMTPAKLRALARQAGYSLEPRRQMEILAKIKSFLESGALW